VKILFIEAGPTMLAKNLLPIAREIAKIKQNTQFIFVSIEILSHADSEKENTSIKQLKELTNSKFHVLKSFKPTTINKYLLEQKPEALILDAYRIYDMLWILIAKSLGIRVYGFQHGFEVDNVYYKPHIIVNKLKKSLRMLTALYYLSKLMQKDFLLLVSQFSKYFFEGKKLQNSYFNSTVIQPDHVFIYSDYYRYFWHSKFGLNTHLMTVIGPPDLMMVNEIIKKPKIKGCCYLTQTLVEDGRMTKHKFDSLLNEYKYIARSFEKFVLKIHPRGNKDLYNELAKLENVELMREFPNCDYYLTHYSSTAFVAYHISPRIILHELDGHPTPDIFKRFGFNILTNSSKIVDAFKETDWSKTTMTEKNLAYYAPVPAENPNFKVAESIVKLI